MFRGLSKIDFVQINSGKVYQELPQTTSTRNTYNFANIKIEFVKNQSILVAINTF